MKSVLRFLIPIALVSTPQAVAQFDRQPPDDNSCKRRITMDGWKVDVWKTGVEVHTTDETLIWAMPEGYSLQGIKGITLWDKDDVRQLTFRIPLLKNDAGQTVNTTEFHASPLSVILSESSSDGMVRTPVIDRMAGEHGFYHLTNADYTKTKFGVGKVTVTSLDFDFWAPNPQASNVYMRASVRPEDMRRGFTLWDNWEAWRKAGCMVEDEPEPQTTEE